MSFSSASLHATACAEGTGFNVADPALTTETTDTPPPGPCPTLNLAAASTRRSDARTLAAPTRLGSSSNSSTMEPRANESTFGCCSESGMTSLP